MAKKRPVYVFIEESSGIGKESGKPYHFLKLANPDTFQNHRVAYDPNRLTSINFLSGERVHVDFDLATPYNNTQALAYNIEKQVI